MFCTTCRSPFSRQFDYLKGELQIVESSIEYSDGRLPDDWPQDGEIAYHIMVDEGVERMKEFAITPVTDGKSFSRYIPKVQEKLDEIHRNETRAQRDKAKSILFLIRW